MTENTHDSPLLTVRTAVVLVAASHVGTGFGVLTYLSASDPVASTITTLATFGAAALGLHKVIGSN
jgi:hypothetical protein